MGIKTKKQYLESLRELNPTIYIAGSKLEGHFAESPYFRTNLNLVCLTFDLANDPKWEKSFTAWSPLIEDKVSWWTSVPQSTEDLVRVVRNIKAVAGTKFCVFCMGIALSVIWAITHEIDQENNTKYHERVKNFFKRLQKNDLRFCMGIMDPKGDRGLKPSKQPDLDMHLRVVRKNKNGIVVRGCKSQVSGGPLTHMILVAPCRAYDADEKDFVVSFAIPTDTKGITYITRPAAGPLEKMEYANPVSSEVGWTEHFAVFEDVVVPWENVFMCGEWEFTERFINYFSAYARLVKGVCCSARTDMLIGAAALVAQCNGIDKAGHVRSKLTDMMTSSLCGYGCALAAATESKKHASGIMIPDIAIANAGLYEGRLKLAQYFGTLMELAGGVITTMPLEADYKNPETKGWIDKYLKGKSSMSTEERFRILNLAQDICASRFTGYFMSSILCAGGTPETNRVEVFRNYNLGEKLKVAKSMAKIQGSIFEQDR